MDRPGGVQLRGRGGALTRAGIFPEIFKHGGALIRLGADTVSAVYTVAICDPEPIAVAGLRELGGWESQMVVLAAESSLSEAVEAVKEAHPDVLLVHACLGWSAIAGCVATLRSCGCRTPVVVWRAAISWPESMRLLEAGVSGVVRRTASLQTLLACLRAVVGGGLWADGDLRMSMPRPGVRASRLTPRESQIFDLMERGLRYSEIGQLLGIRPGTVKVHLRHISEKTGAQSRYRD